MKILFFLLFGLIIIGSDGGVFAQNRKLTIILLRHAEKDLTDGNKTNPELSAAGKQRAERLVETVGKYKPDLIYSTYYKRTKSTVLPLAETVDARYRIPIRIYDFGKLEEFAGELLKSKARTIVVVGHNSTTPELANLLTKQEKYQELGENEYDKIWIVEIRRYKRKPHKIKDKVIEY
ncbi:MAG TPA: phosphoglycerate mutase family protein [Pyrinomonadaceae bacterium]|nr:phosphoglycerate mutase family protein [Pyrinomonadaceae bacterium]